YILSSTFVPVLSIWLLKHEAEPERPRVSLFDRLRSGYEGLVRGFVKLRWLVVGLYLAGSLAVIGLLGPQLGRSIFPAVDAGQFRLRMRAPDGTHIERSEQLAQQALQLISEELGPENVDLTLGY